MAKNDRFGLNVSDTFENLELFLTSSHAAHAATTSGLISCTNSVNWSLNEMCCKTGVHKFQDVNCMVPTNNICTALITRSLGSNEISFSQQFLKIGFGFLATLPHLQPRINLFQVGYFNCKSLGIRKVFSLGFSLELLQHGELSKSGNLKYLITNEVTRSASQKST